MTTVISDRRRPAFTLRHRMVLAREVAQMDQTQIAGVLGVTRSTVSNYERGFTEPKRHMIAAWALATGVEFEWLAEGRESPRPDTPGGGEEWAPWGSNPRPAD